MEDAAVNGKSDHIAYLEPDSSIIKVMIYKGVEKTLVFPSKKRIRTFIRSLGILILVLLLGGTCKVAIPSENPNVRLPLLPLPAFFKIDGDLHYRLSTNILLYTHKEFDNEASALKEWLETTLKTKVTISYRDVAPQKDASATVIVLRHSSEEKLLSVSKEAYSLSIGSTLPSLAQLGIQIEALDAAGIFYGIQTLIQIIASAPFGPYESKLLPVCTIKDTPRFAWRGSMLDCSRHFISIDYLKQHLERMAACKMNLFHWHLSDDQGWRLPVNSHPKLTTVGAWRRSAEPYSPLESYGGFYTENDINALVSYAHNLHITIVPEIDMPGHMSAAIAAYPELACDSASVSKPHFPLSEWGTFDHLLCPGKESTFQFVEAVLDQLCALFPDPWIHFGGDEVESIAAWQDCPECQKKMKELGYTDPKQLEGYFINRIEKAIRARGKIPVGWGDAVPSLGQNTTVLQYWSRYRHLAEGRTRGFQFVLSPADYTYLDMNQQEDEPQLWAGYISMSKAYSIDPSLWNLNDQEVLGIEAPLWTEYTPTLSAVDQHIWPRLTAIAEAGWTQKQQRSWPSFKQRLAILTTLSNLPKMIPPEPLKNRIRF